MILAIDIGNTTTNFGVFDQKKLVSQFSIATEAGTTAPKARWSPKGVPTGVAYRPTQPWRTPDEVTLQLKALAKSRYLHLARATQIILCSVVPRMSSVLIQSLRGLNTTPIRIVGYDVQVPLKNGYTYPEQVGQDRLVGAYAAWKEFGKGQGAGGKGRGNDCIVADFGTAITIDVVTKQGTYLGGLIAPGLEISLEALAIKTALLPKVELREPPELLGRDTANSIRSGLLFGCASLCDGLITQLKRRYASNATVIATGGASPLVAKHCHTIDYLKPHLVLEGLHHLARYSC